MVVRVSEKRWEVCLSGHLHRGIYGGAGLLLRYTPSCGEPLFLLAERLRSPGVRVWGTPVGVMKRTEAPEMAARRGAAAEISPLPRYRVIGVDSEDCGGGWQFHVVSADVSRLFTAHAVRETCRTGWFTIGQMSTLPLASEFRNWVDERIAPLRSR